MILSLAKGVSIFTIDTIDTIVHWIEIVSIVLIERIDILLGVINWNSEVNRQIDSFVYCVVGSVYSVDRENRHLARSNKLKCRG